MFLNLDNEIDKKFSETYSEEIIKNATKDNLEYLGMNISEADNNDIQLKIYYDNKPSRELYKNLGDQEALINFLYQKNMITGLEIVHDKKNTRCTRYNIKLKYRHKNNMLDLFSWMENNIKFFSKYKDEILKLSQFKYADVEDALYASLFFMGVEIKNDDIDILKLYWIKNPKYEKEYIETIENCDIPQLKELLPITFQAVENCGGNFLMTGINYNSEMSEKHKYYIEYPTNLYDGLIKTFPEKQELIRKIEKIRIWHEIHPEYICDGFAIGKNSQNQILLKFYFMFKKEN